jgi:hypothetical protein
VTTKTSTSFLPASRFEEQFRSAIETASLRDLDNLARKLWAAHGAGAISDDQAHRLGELIQQRRRGQAGATRSLAASTPTPGRSYIQRSPEQRSPDRRASLLRRRQHAATGPLPPNLAAGFTTGELAALKIVADECLAHGACDLSKNEIGARAGVCKTVVKRALKLAEVRLTMISVLRRPRSGRKHLTSIIRIIRAEWLTWLDKGNRRAYAIKACERAKPDFKRFRGVHMDPPRAQIFRKAAADLVDKTQQRGNRTGAGRAGL